MAAAEPGTATASGHDDAPARPAEGATASRPSWADRLRDAVEGPVRRSGLGRRLGRLPVVAVLLGLYALTRIWGWIAFSLVARQQGNNPWTVARPTYLEFIGFWDSDWYRYIALHGYPSVLPVAADGTVRQNPWAFYPLFPYTVRFVSRATGLDFVGAGTLVSLACGAVASLLLYQFFAAGRARASGALKAAAADDAALGENLNRAGLWSAWRPLLLPVSHADRASLWATALVLLSPVSAVLQVPYAESMGLMFLAGTLWALMGSRWGLCAVLMVPTCLSRPVGVPLAAAIGLWWAFRVLDDAGLMPGRPARSGPLRARVLGGVRRNAIQLALALFACACALLWPLIAWAATGRRDAYTATETAWRGQHLAPFQPWYEQSQVYFGAVGPWVLAGLLLAFVLLMLSRTVRRTIPASVRLWCWTYATYLVAFLFPQSSTFRMLLPMFPLAGPAVALSGSRAYRLLLLGGAALGQLIWIGWLWHFKALPSGGDFPP